MRSFYIRPLFAVVLFALVATPAFLAGCDSANPVSDGPDLGNAGAASSTAEVIVSGSITTNTTWTSDNNYVLNGIVDVTNGAVLTIEPGTLIQGSSNQPSALLIQQGSQLIANGTESEPIVFTSREPVGQRAPGDWGGVIIIGNSTCNGAPGDCFVEGLPAPFDNLTYGGNPVNESDNSGILRYVRIEFAGFELTPTREINGLTLYSVGSGTTLDFVQVHKGSDDGFEFFGGTVNGKHLVATGAQDDSFDFSYGYNGNLQFLIIQQDRFSGDRGFEIDNNEIQNTSTDFLNEPLTDPTVYNVTAIGRFPSGAGEDNKGIVLRRGAGGEYNNIIIGGFGSYFLDIDDQATFDNCGTDDLLIRGGIGVPLTGLGVIDPDSDNELNCVQLNSFSSSDPQPFPGAISRTNPDFRFRNTSLITNNNLVQTPPAGFFDSVNYVGAIAPGTSQSQTWYFGWTSFPAN